MSHRGFIRRVDSPRGSCKDCHILPSCFRWIVALKGEPLRSPSPGGLHDNPRSADVPAQTGQESTGDAEEEERSQQGDTENKDKRQHLLFNPEP